MTPKQTLTLLMVACVAISCDAWTGLPTRTAFAARSTIPGITLKSAIPSDDVNVDVDNPCWQDIWNYDCAMSTVYSAAFVANDWLKTMPCAAGIVDCDTPEELKMPGPSVNSGVESVDVMSYLNLKRAEPLRKPNEKKP
eukprot:37552_1